MSWTACVLLLCVVCGNVVKSSLPSKDITLEQQKKWVVSRFIHGCPFAFPCPPPPCDNPVWGPHDCCGSCPDPDPEPEVTQSPEMSNPKFFDKRGKLPKRRQLAGMFGETHGVARAFMPARIRTTTPPPTTSECPYPCVYNGRHYCHPFPCHIRCVDSITPPRSCCEVCPNGPNCAYNGHIIPEGKNSTLPDGTVVYCDYGELGGGSVRVFQSVVG